MIRYREILRLYSQGISKTAIAQSCECSRNTVSKVVQRAEEVGITWPLAPDLTDTKLQKRLLPSQICPRTFSCRITRPFIKNWLKAALH